MKKNLIAIILVTLVGLGFTSCATDSSSDTAAAKADVKKEAPKVDAAKKADAKPAVDPDLPKTTVEFDKTTLDFGTIEQEGGKVKGVFKITNTGNEPLIISSAKGSCGCTVPKWPKEPIAPGATADMDVEFNPKGKKGKQTKTVTIQANTDPNPTRLTVKAEILVPEGATDAAAPAAK